MTKRVIVGGAIGSPSHKENIFQHPRPGDKVIVTMRDSTRGHRRIMRYTGTVEAVTEYFTVIYTGRYRVTVSAADLHCGQAMAETLEWKAGQSGE
ncbi:MAG: hypothetical protein KGZ50_03005 [Peptococcaceae bacterium]|nr:hypothetical protein [Peptococcaceae bacterium]